MILLVIGRIAVLVGEILLGFTVITVHRHIIKEHTIDRDVLRTMKSEQRIAFYGIILILVGGIIEISQYYF